MMMMKNNAESFVFPRGLEAKTADRLCRLHSAYRDSRQERTKKERVSRKRERVKVKEEGEEDKICTCKRLPSRQQQA